MGQLIRGFESHSLRQGNTDITKGGSWISIENGMRMPQARRRRGGVERIASRRERVTPARRRRACAIRFPLTKKKKRVLYSTRLFSLVDIPSNTWNQLYNYVLKWVDVMNRVARIPAVQHKAWAFSHI